MAAGDQTLLRRRELDRSGLLVSRPPGPLDDTEGFHGAPPLARVRDYSPDGVRSSLEASLQRLGLDADSWRGW